jgi:hypothetical protein
MFNALKYTQEMERAGFSREQAEVSMKVLIDVMNENFATKSDLKDLELEMKAGFRETNLRFESAIRELDYKLTIKLGTMLTVAIGATATLVKLLQAFH